MKVLYWGVALFLIVTIACDDREVTCVEFQESPFVDLDNPRTGQKSLYLRFQADEYGNLENAALQLTQDTLVMEVIGEDAFGISIMEYYAPGSPLLTDPDAYIDTAYYSMTIANDSLMLDWDVSSTTSSVGRLFDYGIRYPMQTQSYEFEKHGWKVFPRVDMPQYGVTGVVTSYQPFEEHFGICKVRYDWGSVISHIERPIWIYQQKYGLIARYSQFTPGDVASGFILTLQ